MDEMWNWGLLLWHLVLVAIYTTVGLGALSLAYLVIDKLTPFSLGKQLVEEKNMALAIVLGSAFIAVAIILSASIRG